MSLIPFSGEGRMPVSSRVIGASPLAEGHLLFPESTSPFCLNINNRERQGLSLYGRPHSVKQLLHFIRPHQLKPGNHLTYIITRPMINCKPPPKTLLILATKMSFCKSPFRKYRRCLNGTLIQLNFYCELYSCFLVSC